MRSCACGHMKPGPLVTLPDAERGVEAMGHGRDGRCGEGYLEEDGPTLMFLRRIVDEKNGERCRRIDVKRLKSDHPHFVLSQSLAVPLLLKSSRFIRWRRQPPALLVSGSTRQT